MRILLSLFLLISIVACKSEPETTEDQSSYLRFEDALQNDVSNLMQYSTNILYKKWENQTLIDSSFIDTTQFLAIIDQFWMEEMKHENFSKLFREVPVLDETNQQLQFHYFALNTNSILGEVKVITSPNQKNEHTISTVLFEISDAEKRQKVMWKLNEMIQIITIMKNNDGKVIVEELIWEPSKFFE